MKTISLCGRPDGVCCPSVKEDEEKGIMYIVDGDQKIAFNKEQKQKLAEYLCKKENGCQCASCKGLL